MNIKSRLALVFAAIVAGTLMLMSGFIYFFSEKNLYEGFYERLEQNAQILGFAKLNSNRYSDSLYYEVKAEYLQKLPEEHDYIMRIVKGATSLRFSHPLPLSDDFFKEAILSGKAIRFVNGTAYVALYFKDKNHKEDLLVVSHANTGAITEELSTLKETLFWGLLIFVLLTFSVSIWFADYSLRPIKQTIREMDRIHSSNLNLRLKSDGKKHELSRLNDTFNNLLDRLEVTFNLQQSFISNASHSFRTPLTIIIGEAELAMADLKEGNHAKVGASLEVIHRKSMELKEIISGLLGLIRSSGHGETELWEVVRADEIVEHVRDAARQISRGINVKIDLQIHTGDERALQVFGHKNLLILAVFNIVANACKYSDNKPVVIGLEAGAESVAITVSDEGIGIPEPDLEKIFSPFFRASNAREYEGAGIGLPLTLNILRLHNARIQVDSELTKGTLVRIVLPNILAGSKPATR